MDPERPKRRATARTKARRRAVDVLFEADQRGRYQPLALSDLLQERLATTAAETPLPAYSAELVEGVAGHLEDIDDILLTYAHGRTLDRMPAVDRAILRMAVWELLFDDEIDDAVVISEAVKLAAELSTEGSPRFVNAILDKIRVLGPALRLDLRGIDPS
ncbi:MAG: transcription antitermination factor NusB [Actinomycetales bacterium]|jgi:NusB antitermination factor|nr:transcription antitermination factor NusB [Actinomycetales bacterium]